MVGSLHFDDPNVQLMATITCATAVASITALLLWKHLKKSAKVEYPKDTVIHHQVGRGPHAPSMTPFALKLETYLRFAKIPYLNVHDMKRSKKGKLTWIEYNGEDVADSEFCIEYLNEKLGVDLDKHLTSRDRGTARAFEKMLEENTYWVIVLERWIYDESHRVFKLFKLPTLLGYYILRQVKNMCYAHGIGRHSQEEVYHIMAEDFKALSNYLGKNKFICGNSPCQEDCAIFGILAQFYWQGFGMRGEICFKKYTNLCDYCERMKEMFWPDWDQCITKGGTQKATN